MSDTNTPAIEAAKEAPAKLQERLRDWIFVALRALDQGCDTRVTVLPDLPEVLTEALAAQLREASSFLLPLPSNEKEAG